MSSNVDAAVQETASIARAVLFNSKGQPWPEGYYLSQIALQSVIRKATIDEVVAGLHPVFDLKGTTFLYDASYAELLLDDAKNTPPLTECFVKPRRY